MADVENDPADPENRESRDAWAYRRFATRIPGEGWTARIRGIGSPVTVINLSRIGIALETEEPLAAYQRYPLQLTGPGGTTETQFYVLRCPEITKDGSGPVYRPAGLFVATIPREDLPEAIPESPPQASRDI
jgi:hypothetical protein